MRSMTAAFLATTLLIAGCSRNLDSNTYTSSSTVGKVVYGTVVSARQVTVKENDKLEQNTMGGLAGGVAGGVAGSAIGGGTGRSLATVGGAIGGAVLGAMIQDQLGTSTGTEYIVQLDAAQRTTTSTSKRNYKFGSDKPSADINQSIQLGEQEAQAISVVQQDQQPIAVGQRVMVVYSDDRPRVVPVR